LITQGWTNISTPSTAASSFQQALAVAQTAEQRIDASNGLGWSLARSSKIIESVQYFETAAPTVPEAKVGLAGALLHRRQGTDIQRAATLLKELPPQTFVASHSQLGLTRPRVLALAALACAFAGDTTNARTYMSLASQEDAIQPGTTVDRIDEAFTLLGWKN